jgi:hypothetical protein
MTNQKFLLDNKKLGRLLKVETFEVTRTLNQIAMSGKKKTVTKKKYLITVYQRIMVPEEVMNEDGTEVSTVQKEKFVKWAEFSFAESLHPKDRIREILSKTEIPLSYLTDKELTDEVKRRNLLSLETLPDDIMTDEMKRRGLTEYANNFKISKNASIFQKLKAIILERKQIPPAKLSFEETIKELKKRHLLEPGDIMTDDELIKDLERRDIRIGLPPIPAASEKDKATLDALFEDDIPPSPDELDISEVTGIPLVDLKKS